MVLAMLCVAAGLAIASACPIQPFLVLGLFAAWIAFAITRFSYALPATIALVPVIGFAKWTGWLTFEEFDLLVLATAAGGYARRALPDAARASTSTAAWRDAARLSLVSLALIVCYFAAGSISLQRGLTAAGPFSFGWTRGLTDPLNALRMFKGLAWTLLLCPLVRDEMRSGRGLDRIGAGFAIGLGLVGLVVLQERYAFIGLLDFSQDYRATGPFWEMHVGGATLDAFLVLSIPFAVREALRARARHWFVAACLILGLSVYAILATFSRGLYLAMAVEIGLLAIVVLARQGRLGGLSLLRAICKWGVFGLCVAIGDFVVFRFGGYRGVIAALAVFAMALRVGPLVSRASASTMLLAIFAGGVLGLGGYLVAIFVPKGPYLVFTLVFALVAAAIVNADRRASQVNLLLAFAAWIWLAIAAVVVAGLWGGAAAGRDSATVIACLVGVVAITTRVSPKSWQRTLKSQAATVGIAMLVIAPITVLSAGAYMGDRLSSSGDDFRFRLNHWTEAIARLQTTDDWLFGMGLGRYPASSIFTTGAAPGNYVVRHQAEGSFLQLSAPAGLPYLGFGQLFRFTQIVAVAPHQRYQLSFQARAAKQTGLHLELCEKHLIYSLECTGADASIAAGPDRWGKYAVALDSGDLGDSPWYASKPIVFAVAIGDVKGVVDLRDIHLFGPDGRDLIVNGTFANDTARWFSSSDMNHQPFHIFNFAVGVLFDQGVIGLGLLAMLVVGVLVRTTIGSARRHPDAAFVATPLVSFLVLGLFDNLIDAPRIAFLFYFILLLGLMLRNPPVARAVAPRAPVAPSAPAPIDEAAERAKRRQHAFGTRKRVDA